MAVDYAIINQTMGKMAHYLGTHNSIAVSVSGGSDSDLLIHIIATYFREMLPKIHFVFVNTGLEYQATKDHLKYCEEKYNIKIDRVRGVSVVTAVRKHGVPIISKEFSQKTSGYLRGLNYAVNWYNGGRGQYSPPEKQKEVIGAIKDRNIKVSHKCCDVSKKYPLFKYYRQHKVDLSVTGERRSEGGIRATRHTSCFECANHYTWDKYMPLFFWNDETKQYYKESEGIKYSDCYEVWGFKRTGCVGCPFNSRVADDLRIVKQYEPNLYKACVNVFGVSYRLIDEFDIQKHKILDDPQIRFEDMENNMVGEPPSDAEGW